MDELLKANIEAMEATTPHLAAAIRETELPPDFVLGKSRDNWPVLAVSGVNLHSRYDPWTEADMLAERFQRNAHGPAERLPAVFGLGLGYHVLALLRKIEPLLVIEPNMAMIRAAMTALDFTTALSSLTFIFDRSQADDLPEIDILAHAPSVRLNRGDYNFWTLQTRLLKDKQACTKKLTENNIYIYLLQELAGDPCQQAGPQMEAL